MEGTVGRMVHSCSAVKRRQSPGLAFLTCACETVQQWENALPAEQPGAHFLSASDLLS